MDDREFLTKIAQHAGLEGPEEARQVAEAALRALGGRLPELLRLEVAAYLPRSGWSPLLSAAPVGDPGPEWRCREVVSAVSMAIPRAGDLVVSVLFVVAESLPIHVLEPFVEAVPELAPHSGDCIPTMCACATPHRLASERVPTRPIRHAPLGLEAADPAAQVA